MSLEGKSTIQLSPERIKAFEEARQAFSIVREMQEEPILKDSIPGIEKFLEGYGHDISPDGSAATKPEALRSAELMEKMAEDFRKAAEAIRKVA